MVRHLRLLRSAWGLSHLGSDPPRAVAHVCAAGLDGIEASLGDIGCSKKLRALCEALKQQGRLLILSAYSSWPNYEGEFDARSSVQDHITAFERELKEIAECHASFPQTVVRINGHSGSDAWSQAEANDYFGAVTDTATSWGLPLAHETHRGRYLCCPFATRRMLSEVPNLRLTLDFSHWVLKCERLLDSEEESTMLRREIAPAVDHIHARIGTRHLPQVADLQSPLVAYAAERYYSLWEDVWSSHEEASVSSRSSIATATMEYGPREYDINGDYVGYTPVDSKGCPIARTSLDETIATASTSLRNRFDHWHSDSVRRRFAL